MELPQPLFKYLSTDRACQVLCTGTIRFTQPQFFNDPFEFLPALDIERAKKTYLADQAKKGTLRNNTDRKEVLKGLKKFLEGVAHHFAKEYEAVGALSLSKRCDIPLMWSHYAANHTGVVLGIKADDRLLAPALNTTIRDKYCDIGKVKYDIERYKYPGLSGDNLGFLFIKDQCWKYEKEWRVIRSLESLTKAKEEVYVSSFTPNAIRCVIFGALTPKDKIQENFEILKDNAAYSHLKFFKSTLSADTFELDITTHIGSLLDEEDIRLEAHTNKIANYLYKTVSKGKLFLAMELLAPNTKFEQEKNIIDFG